ncbi:MAG: glycosyltransferase family 2 protein [Oscillospiraceae bacterium]|nr:glycosyltransferase family 2 protein [Oscillospiraceae bacterium]
MRLLIIIPCYNEQETIAQVYREVCEKVSYDVLVINDHSTDDSREILQNEKIPHLNLPLNLGIGGAVQTGYRYALRNGYDITVQLDGDGQHDPGYIADIIAPIESGEADLVIGSRFMSGLGFRSSVMRRAGIRIFKALIYCLSGKRITDATSGFRAVGHDVMELFNLYYADDYPEPESTMLALRNGYRVYEVPVIMRERQGGVSSIKSLQPAYYMLKVSLGIIISAIQGRVRDMMHKY